MERSYPISKKSIGLIANLKLVRTSLLILSFNVPNAFAIGKPLQGVDPMRFTRCIELKPKGKQ